MSQVIRAALEEAVILRSDPSHGEEGWIGVDLDGTLAHWDGWKGYNHIGEPIAPMVERVRNWLAEGKKVKIFTARATEPEAIPPIEKWCMDVFGRVLPVTNQKDRFMLEMWDDRCKAVRTNTGEQI